MIEEDHYYPFGLKHTQYNTGTKEYNPHEGEITLDPIPPGGEVMNKYKYNGKEWQDELGLNEYDYGARFYDPAIGRWMNMDNLADKYSDNSPFGYALNNPVSMLDPDGNLVISAAFAARYPQITRYLRENIKSDVLSSSVIMDALAEVTRQNGNANGPSNLNSTTVGFGLTDGSGPGIDFDESLTGGLHGRYDDASSTLMVSAEHFDRLESILSSSQSNSEDQLEALLGVSMVVLHEFSHWGDQLDGEFNRYNNGEVGDSFEYLVWFYNQPEDVSPLDDMDPMAQKEIIKNKRNSNNGCVLPTLPSKKNNGSGAGGKPKPKVKTKSSHPGSAGPANKRPRIERDEKN